MFNCAARVEFVGGFGEGFRPSKVRCAVLPGPVVAGRCALNPAIVICIYRCGYMREQRDLPLNPFIRAYDNFLDLAFGLERGWKCEGRGSVFEASSLQTNDLGHRQDIWGK